MASFLRPRGSEILEPTVPKTCSPSLYANFFRVGHNADELVIELCQYAEVVTRIFVTPAGARELHRLLGQSLDKQCRLHARTARRRAT